MPSIVLATLNTRHSHASLGLRYLRANLGALSGESVIREFVVSTPADVIAQRLLTEQPRLIGFGVYIWNVAQTARVIARLKDLAPEVAIVIGGPEVSHEIDQQPICRIADFIVTGWGDITFARLARALLEGPRPLMKVHAGEQPPLDQIALPYREYSDADLAHRYVYVEASRGCPFKCEFCLSALDRTAWAFPLPPLLADLQQLYERGGRRFKFVDRTFNLKVACSAAILEFFLGLIGQHPQDPPFLHFELIPDRLPERLKELVARFPPGTLQFEIGIQTFNVDVQHTISRRQDNTVAEANLHWLRTHSAAHLHVDLIAGLPGEDLDSFAAGFNRLVALGPHEIQFGILKRLRGTPIGRHTGRFGMRFNPEPPYNVLETDRIDAATMQRLARFARYWDLIANSGRFPRTLPLLLGDAPFARFLALTDWLYRTFGRTHSIANELLYERLREWLVMFGIGDRATQALTADYVASGARGRLAFAAPAAAIGRVPLTRATPPRQARRLRV